MTNHRFMMITDARVGRDAEGTVATPDYALAGDNWKRGLQSISGMEYAVRVDPASSSGSFTIDGLVHPLPHYIGLRGFLACLPKLLIRMWRLIGQTDVVVTRLPGLIGALAVVLSRLRRRPIAVEVVGDVRDAMQQSDKRAWTRSVGWLAAVVTGVLVKQARAVRYVTQSVLQVRYPPARHASVAAFSSVVLTEWLEHPKGPVAEQPTVIAVGSQEQLYKGHDLLVRAFVDVLLAHPGARLILVGAGRSQALLRALATEVGLEEAIQFRGYEADRGRLIELVDSAWVYAMPSRTEGLPRALVEGMARGKACVGAEVGGITELLDDAQLIPPDDVAALSTRLTELLHDGDLRTRLGRRNLAHIGPYMPSSIQRCAEDWAYSVRHLASV